MRANCAPGSHTAFKTISVSQDQKLNGSIGIRKSGNNESVSPGIEINKRTTDIAKNLRQDESKDNNIFGRTRSKQKKTCQKRNMNHNDNNFIIKITITDIKHDF
jgi:hypothetical protein